MRCSAADTPAISFANTRWAPLQKHLDTLPVFTCVNADGNPLGYERDGEPIALYFAEAERAQQELQQMGERFPELGLRIIGVGLGDIFRQHTEGRALLVGNAGKGGVAMSVLKASGRFPRAGAWRVDATTECAAGGITCTAVALTLVTPSDKPRATSAQKPAPAVMDCS